LGLHIIWIKSILMCLQQGPCLAAGCCPRSAAPGGWLLPSFCCTWRLAAALAAGCCPSFGCSLAADCCPCSATPCGWLLLLAAGCCSGGWLLPLAARLLPLIRPFLTLIYSSVALGSAAVEFVAAASLFVAADAAFEDPCTYACYTSLQ